MRFSVALLSIGKWQIRYELTKDIWYWRRREKVLEIGFIYIKPWETGKKQDSTCDDTPLKGGEEGTVTIMRRFVLVLANKRWTEKLPSNCIKIFRSAGITNTNPYSWDKFNELQERLQERKTPLIWYKIQGTRSNHSDTKLGNSEVR